MLVETNIIVDTPSPNGYTYPLEQVKKLVDDFNVMINNMRGQRPGHGRADPTQGYDLGIILDRGNIIGSGYTTGTSTHAVLRLIIDEDSRRLMADIQWLNNESSKQAQERVAAGGKLIARPIITIPAYVLKEMVDTGVMTLAYKILRVQLEIIDGPERSPDLDQTSGGEERQDQPDASCQIPDPNQN